MGRHSTCDIQNLLDVVQDSLIYELGEVTSCDLTYQSQPFLGDSLPVLRSCGAVKGLV